VCVFSYYSDDAAILQATTFLEDAVQVRLLTQPGEKHKSD